MHDISDLENRGVPSIFVASTEFVEAAAVQSKALGFNPAAVFVSHPVQGRTPEEVQAMADGAVEDILAEVTKTEGN